jgi:hypothetical protein
MLQGWLAYADAYAAQFGLPIGTSSRKQEWVAAGVALRTLLNSGGETGRLDVARLNGVIAQAMQMNSIDS